MAGFNRSGGSDRGRSYGNNRSFGNRGSVRPTLHKAICSKCGKECEVPFQPTGVKPVFCRDCFRENGGGDVRRPDDRNFSRPAFTPSPAQNPQYKEELATVNAKLDKILSILTAAIAVESKPEVDVKAHAAVPTETEKVAPAKKKRAPKKAL